MSGKKKLRRLVAEILQELQRALAYFLIVYTLLLGGFICAGLIYQILASE